MTMEWKEAATHPMPFGKYRGVKLDKIAETDEGLLYLDWLVGQPWVKGRLRLALGAYLADASIKTDLQAVLDRRRG